METIQNKNGKNGAKPPWKLPIEKDKFTEEEIELIKASRAVMKVIEKQKARGDFDEYLQQKADSEK